MVAPATKAKVAPATGANDLDLHIPNATPELAAKIRRLLEDQNVR